MEKMMPSELYKKKKPLTEEGLAKAGEGAKDLEQEELERAGEVVADSDMVIPNWQKKINEEILRDDHDLK